MVKITPTVRFAALGALVLGFAFAGSVVSASAAGMTAAPAAAPATTTGADQANSNGPGGPLGKSDTTGEGALSTSPCYADMPVYNKEGVFLGRGLVNTCK